MKPAVPPADEEQRLAELRSLDILDTEAEKDFDDIVRLVAHICDTPISNISFVDADRQWFKAAVGLEDRETPRDVAFCAHTILGDELFVVEDAATDERFHDNPLVTDNPGIRFYAGMPLTTASGARIGALCAIDRTPRQLTDEQRNALAVLSRHVSTMLELRRANVKISEQNRRLQELSDLKSRLMAILAHDLRSPMANIVSFISLLQNKAVTADEQQELLDELASMLKSTEYLLSNVIGWSSRELGEAPFEIHDIPLESLVREILEPLEKDVVAKANTIAVEIETGDTVRSDRNVLIFIIWNLLTNANKFTRNGRITVSAQKDSELTRVCVRDTGMGIAPDRISTLFDWNSRKQAVGTDGERGAGLAMLFCHDFSRKIGGQIDVESELGRGTAITLSLPHTPVVPLASERNQIPTEGQTASESYRHNGAAAADQA
ncbi:MAG: sensor histidine kinase [Spirochaetaceae bacterium]|nr:MAG: sensor histidine kinase [Spirochaetaceae bacterium]